MYIKKNELSEDIDIKLKELEPWSHYFKFDENTYTGFYPAIVEKFGNATFCTSNYPENIIQLFRKEYENKAEANTRLFMPIDFLKKIMGRDFADCSVLDIACNDGMKSLYFKKVGAKKVRGVEIRKDCIERAKFVNRLSGLGVEFQHIPVSADDKDFVKTVEPADIVASFGLLYHLNDHIEHVRNLKKLTKKVMIMLSSYQKKRSETKEDKRHPYKSFTGKSIMPTKKDILDLLIDAGFKTTLEIKYHPDMGSDGFVNNCTYLISFV